MLDMDFDAGEMFFSGPVGDYFDDGISASGFREALRSMNRKDVTLFVNSDGGDVFQGMSIVNQIRSYAGKLTIVVDGLAASIASVIAAAAEDTRIYEGSQMMLHNAWTIDIGDADDFRRTAETLDAVDRDIAGVYARKSGKSEDEMLELMAMDKHWRADELLDLGLVDGIIRPKEKIRPAASQRQSIAAAAHFPRRVAAKHKLREIRTRAK